MQPMALKWTSANVKSPGYTAKHEIFVGTQTGSFKQIFMGNDESPFIQKNLQAITELNKDSYVTALVFGNDEKTEILIGRGHNGLQMHTVNDPTEADRFVELQAAPVVGVARLNEQIIAGFATGQIQCALLEDGEISESLLRSAGDNMSRLRQCSMQKNLIATGGKERQNNLKVFDVEIAGKPIFMSKNLPHDSLQLEVPVWDSDVGFINSPSVLGTCSRYGYVRIYDTRTQRRPLHSFTNNEQQMSFSTLIAHDNFIYTGTTTGMLKALDIRKMKSFLHTYKGFAGAITDLHLDESGKYLASASLDRFVRVHDVDSCVMLYQCYVKSKATAILIRECDTPAGCKDADDSEDEDTTTKTAANGKKSIKGLKRDNDEKVSDEEYDNMFDNMQTICENADGDNDSNGDAEEDVEVVQKSARETKKTEKLEAAAVGSKRKILTKPDKNKLKKRQ